jgi:hypothetical protein
MTVQQRDRRTGTAVPDPQRDVIHAHMLKMETVEHEPLPGARAIETASVSFRHLVLDELALAKLELAQKSVRTGNRQRAVRRSRRAETRWPASMSLCQVSCQE